MQLAQKQEISQSLRDQLADVSAFVLIDYTGMTVEQSTQLRNQFRQSGCKYQVYKNSIIRFAIKDTNHESATPLLKGMTGLAYSSEDPGAAARVVRDLAKEVSSLKIKGGVMEGKLLDEKGVEQLADMPGPRELKAQFLALLNTPATNFVRVLNAVPQKVLYLLNAKKEKESA